jgi:alpha-L-fucosidase 2
MMENKLWYNTISKEWMEGLPIGNGRLAVMIWGNENTDIISLNHEWLWRGENRTRDNEKVSGHLKDVRDCLKKGDFFRATSLANAYFGGLGGISGLPHRTDAYQPAGDLIFTLKDCTSFCRRELDLVKCVARAERLAKQDKVSSAFIAHPKHNLIICRWNASSGKFSGSLRYSRAYDSKSDESCYYSQSGINYSCSFKDGISYKTVVSIKTDGEIKTDASGIYIEDATGITAYINIAVSVKGIEEELAIHPVPESDWDALLSSHTEAFSELLNRISLEVSMSENELPTDERILRVRSGIDDPGLLLLYFNFGRYLLASSSICGELPANLQGKWNDSIEPPWECDYHLNINLQMNYWMAEAANMPECAEALLKYIERFVPHAKKAAYNLYSCRGIWLPHSTDAWGRATPEGYGWAAWVGAAPWMAQHFWHHFEYSGDINFLKDRAYPFFKEVALFFEDYLVEDENGIYQIMPSQSPENRFTDTGFWPVSIGISSAMDVQLVYDALRYAVKSAEILDIDAKVRKKWKRIIECLPPFKIGSDGRLLEWDAERPEAEPGHRHLSHLYGLFPSDIFNPADRPAQYEAAVKSLEFRLSQGGGHTGWSRAWTACLFARIGREDELWRHLYALLTDFATVSLLDLHPPRIFQIDGNLGAVEAVLQALVQCWGGKVHLLRALPSAWPKGSIKGIKTRGGHTLTLSWCDGKLETVDIIIGYSGSIILSGLAGKVKIAENIAEQGENVIITGSCGTKIRLLIES